MVHRQVLSYLCVVNIHEGASCFKLQLRPLPEKSVTVMTQIDVGENNEKAISYAMTLMDLNLI